MKFKAHKLIGFVIFACLTYKIDCTQIANVLFYCNPLWLLFAFFLSLPHAFFKSMRWKYILKSQGHNVPQKDVFLYYLSGIYLGLITPGKLGELSKALYLKQSGVTKTTSNALSSVIIDRLFDLYILFCFSMTGIIYFDKEQIPTFLGWCGLGISIFIPFLLYSKLPLQCLSNFLLNRTFKTRTSERLSDNIKLFINDFKFLTPFKFLNAGILTLISYIIFFIQCALISISITMSIDYLELFLGMATANLLSMVPITIAGLGTRELVLYFLWGHTSVIANEIIAYSIAILIVFYLGGAVLGFISWWLKPLLGRTKPRNE